MLTFNEQNALKDLTNNSPKKRASTIEQNKRERLMQKALNLFFLKAIIDWLVV